MLQFSVSTPEYDSDTVYQDEDVAESDNSESACTAMILVNSYIITIHSACTVVSHGTSALAIKAGEKKSGTGIKNAAGVVGRHLMKYKDVWATAHGAIQKMKAKQACVATATVSAQLNHRCMHTVLMTLLHRTIPNSWRESSRQ